jgi:predicted Zn-dependent protease
MNVQFNVKNIGIAALAAALAAWATGCETVNAVVGAAADAAAAGGVITTNQAEHQPHDAGRTKTFQDITPEQEYYVGRTVAATVLTQYKPLAKEDLNGYLNRIGQSLAQFSTRPETFGGYHFMALDSDEINAFAAPCGVDRPRAACRNAARNEDQLAAVLAHEIGQREASRPRAIKTAGSIPRD